MKPEDFHHDQRLFETNWDALNSQSSIVKREKCISWLTKRLTASSTKIKTAKPRLSRELNPLFNWTSWVHLFTCKRFHVLLNSLFKVLCNFPSRYLFAIGLTVVFSLRWSLPPTLGCTLKQPDSKTHCLCSVPATLGGLHPLWLDSLIQKDSRNLPRA